MSEGGMLDERTLLRALTAPGAYLPREDGWSVPQWQAAAVQRLLERHAEEFTAVTGMPVDATVWLPGDEEPDRDVVWRASDERYVRVGDLWQRTAWRSIVYGWTNKTWYGKPLWTATWQQLLAEVGWVTDRDYWTV
jgi:hypothetical protein